MKKKKHTYCTFCGKEIRWIRRKGTVKAIPCEARCITFVPDPYGQHIFIDMEGNTRRGRETSDGLIGFYRHACPNFPSRSVRSEKDEQARRWA